MVESVQMFADGASRGNPGPASYGVVFKDEQGQVVDSLSQAIGKATNNAAEYSGLIGGLKAALESGVKHIHVFLDSELVVKQMKGLYRVRNHAIKVYYDEAIGLSAQFESFTIDHVRRAQNAEADALANQALDDAL